MLGQILVEALRPLSFRGKHRLLHAMNPVEGIVSAHIFGAHVQLDMSDAIQRSVYLGTYEPRETALVRRFLRPGMSLVDVGANIGYYSLLAASLVGASGKIFALEPSPYAYSLLENTIQGNGLSHIQTFRIGLSNVSGEVELYVPPDSFHNHTPSMIPNEGGVPIKVQVRTLDECIAAWGLSKIDLLKLDVEGFEPKILTGAMQSLSERKIRAILCEFNDPWLSLADSSSDTLWDLLTQYGFVDIQSPRRKPDLRRCTTRLLELKA